ncbi:MAG: PHP domain-containing protein [Candidatus Hadarchaeota archaeon]|nr:PHP domain-containing protein [Candidatus Hadarchaeota archaeon]
MSLDSYDLHVHTSHSGDCHCPVKDVIREAKAKGLRGIGITDHDSVRGVKEALKPSEKNFLIIPGIEVSSKDGHILGLGTSEPVPAGLPAAKTVKLIRKQGGIAIATHPFGLSLKPFAALRAEYDAVEVFNPRRYFANHLARRFAERRGLPMVAGSDAHNPGEVGLAGIRVRSKPNINSVLGKVKRGEVSTFGRTLPLRDYLRRALYKVFRTYR